MRMPRLTPIAFALLCLFSVPGFAEDEDPAMPQPPEMPEPESPHPGKGREEFTFIEADRVQGHENREVEGFGNVHLKKGDTTLSAEHMIYLQPDDEVFAEQNVRVEKGGDVVTGPELRLKIEQSRGYMRAPAYSLSERGARGQARELKFEGEDHYRLDRASYTTCPVGQDDWFINARDLDIDYTVETGTARNAYITFKGVPVFYTPWINFPLSNERKSGFLAPGFGSSSRSGFDLSVPYYWNIAPNYDATITPRLLSRRGVQINNEFRYLQPNYRGIVHADVLPGDNVTQTNRYFTSLAHNENFGHGIAGGLNLQKASDDSYFRDLSSKIAVTSQTLLPREGWLSYSGGWWNALARVLRYQTLQDPSAPIVAPYDRAPQVLFNAARQNVSGFDLTALGEAVSFDHPTQVNATRISAYPSAAMPLTQPWGYLTPKLGVHYTSYNITQNNVSNLPDRTRALPILSVDSGLYFDREMEFRGTRFLNTLEPRIYYLNIPRRDQSQIPVFDSGALDLTTSTIFAENRFAGIDRVNDANQVTLGLTSRLLTPGTGQVYLSGTVAQQIYFRDRTVTLPGEAPQTARTSDIVASLGGQLSLKWTVNGDLQYDPHEGKTRRFTVNTRYRPETGKVLNLGYRLTQDQVKAFDLSAQWPLGNRWSGLARWNYSIRDHSLLEGLAGLEYNAGCWAVRLVAHQFPTAANQANKSIFVQLELNGVSRLGSNPIDVLKANIPGYVKTNERPDDHQDRYH